MGETRSGLRGVLTRPWPYDLLQRAVGAERIYRVVLEAAAVEPDHRVLDLGCGTAEILPRLPAVRYVGIDRNRAYVERARRRHGAAGEFRCREIAQLRPEELGPFDRVLVLGVLHHLDDEEATHLLRTARAVLLPGGRLTTFDPCYARPQAWLARLALRLDRGRNVRDEAGYTGLARKVFGEVEGAVHHGVLRIPYTHLVMRCEAESARDRESAR